MVGQRTLWVCQSWGKTGWIAVAPQVGDARVGVLAGKPYLHCRTMLLAVVAMLLAGIAGNLGSKTLYSLLFINLEVPVVGPRGFRNPGRLMGLRLIFEESGGLSLLRGQMVSLYASAAPWFTIMSICNVSQQKCSSRWFDKISLFTVLQLLRR